MYALTPLIGIQRVPGLRPRAPSAAWFGKPKGSSPKLFFGVALDGDPEERNAHYGGANAKKHKNE